METRHEISFTEGHHAIVSVLDGVHDFVPVKTEEGARGLMTGWVPGHGKLFQVEQYITHGVGEQHTVDFGFWKVRGTERRFHLTRRVGGFSVRVTRPVNEHDARAWIVVGWHEEEALRTKPLVDRYGRPVMDSIEVPRGDGTTMTVYQQRDEVVTNAGGFPQTVSEFIGVVAKEFDTTQRGIDEVVDEARALADLMIEAWEEHTAPEDDGSEEDRIARVVDRAAGETDDESVEDTISALI